MIIYSAVQFFICFVGKTWLTQSNQIFMIWYGKELSFLSEATLFSIILHIFCFCVFVAEVFIILLYLPINVSRQIRSCKKKSFCTPPPQQTRKIKLQCLVWCSVKLLFSHFPRASYMACTISSMLLVVCAERIFYAHNQCLRFL